MQIALSVDVDDCWAYLRCAGVSEWATAPTFLPTVSTRLLAVLEDLRTTCTLFVVGRDLLIDERVAAISLLVDAGSDVANHSFSHEVNFGTLDTTHVTEEIRRTHELIEGKLRKHTVMFRAPGFSWSSRLIPPLVSLGYRFDSSILPSPYGPVLRALYRASIRASTPHRQSLHGMFGSFHHVRFSTNPFMLASGAKGWLTEFPVSVAPYLRSPLHMSFLVALGQHSQTLMNLYVHSAISLSSRFNSPLNMVLHPLDLLGVDEVPLLRGYPGFRGTSAQRERLVRHVLKILASEGTLMSLEAYARSACAPHARFPAVQ